MIENVFLDFDPSTTYTSGEVWVAGVKSHYDMLAGGCTSAQRDDATRPVPAVFEVSHLKLSKISVTQLASPSANCFINEKGIERFHQVRIFDLEMYYVVINTKNISIFFP